uniref:Uncharacterized protein n=1 Tax=Knipowitschia caucasica TaxID=637954 RepID=A0AAV2L014_KNICA
MWPRAERFDRRSLGSQGSEGENVSLHHSQLDPRRLLPPSSSSSSGSSSGSSPRRNLIVDPRTPKFCSRA